LKALQRVTAFASFDNALRLSAPQVSLGHFAARTSKEILGEIEPFCAAGICAVVLGRPCDEAFKPLTLEAFTERYRKSGADFARALTGAYAYVLFDEKTDSVLAGVDRMARVPLAFAALPGGGIAIATSTHDLRDVPGVTLELNPQALYDYVFFHMIPAPTTLYKGVKRLAPGEQLIAKRGKAEVRAIWQPKFVEDRPTTFEDAKKGFRTALEESVRDAVSSTAAPGTFLSGGTDSSTMTGLVAQVTGKPAKGFSIGFDEEGYDETSYAKIAAKKFPVDHTIYYVTPQDVVDALPRVVEAYDQPFGNASAIPTYYCALRAREQGISAMIAGDGGDELFGGNDRYAEQAKLGRWSTLPNVLRAPVRGAASVFAGLGGPFAKLDRGLKILELPTPARMQHYNLVNRLGAANMFEADFLRDVNRNAPQELLNSIYNGALSNTQLNKMLALDWRVTLSDSDLPKVTSMCAQAGMPVLYPMLNDRVTDFSLSLPTDFKLKGDQLRWFFKEALRDFLPEEIITKQKHGFGLPFGMWLGKHEGMKAQAMAALEDLKKRHIIKPAFIDDIRAKLAGADASYYGVMVWVLVMLELWMQAHHDQS
jgi:asparagine synthase (glutamine-hydrolysing)